MNRPKVANYYNADIRNNGTARRVTEAMRRMGFGGAGFKRFSRPPDVDLEAVDLHLFIDDGRDDIGWLPPSPNACWLVDTHLGYNQRLAWAREFDTVFVAQEPAVERLSTDGVKNVHWLPLACSSYLDPCYKELGQALGRQANLTREYDCCFVGFLNRGGPDGSGRDRVAFLQRVLGAFPNSWLAYDRFFVDAAVRYVKARVGLNISIQDDLNMRFFEVLSYGVCQVCNRDMIGLEYLGFRDGEHFLGFDSAAEAVAQVRWALENPEQRERIARAGHQAVRQGHTYEDRVGQLLKTSIGWEASDEHDVSVLDRKD